MWAGPCLATIYAADSANNRGTTAPILGFKFFASMLKVLKDYIHFLALMLATFIIPLFVFLGPALVFWC